jgi:hypothetical protein
MKNLMKLFKYDCLIIFMVAGLRRKLRAQSSEQKIFYLRVFLKLVSFLLKEINLG